MRKKAGLVVVGLVLIGGLSACTSSPYGIPAGGPHFASWSHLQYSTRGGEKPKLTRQEFEESQKQGWWGTAVAYNIDELE
jgi:hypothetical protein